MYRVFLFKQRLESKNGEYTEKSQHFVIPLISFEVADEFVVYGWCKSPVARIKGES